MNKQSWQEYQATYNRFSQDASHISASRLEIILDSLHRAEATMHRIAETACMRELTRAEEKRDENTEKRVKKLAEELGFEVRFNGDPRGGAIRFVLPSKRSNGWDGETWGIYW